MNTQDRPKRSSAFWRSDIAAAAEAMAYRLGEDYGLDDGQTAALAEAIEATTTSAWPNR